MSTQIQESNDQAAWARLPFAEHAAALVTMTLLSVAFLWRYVRPWEIGHRLQTIDSVIVTWVIAWGRHALLTDPLGYFDANVFWPVENSLAFTHHLILHAIVSVPLGWIGLNPIAIFNLHLYLSFILCGYFVFLLARWLGGEFRLAILAGLIASFCPARVFHTNGQLHILGAYWIPLFLLFFLAYARSGQRRHLAGFFCTFWLTVLTGWYAAILGATALSVPWLAEFARKKTIRDRTCRKRAFLTAGAAALAMALTLPLAMPYLAHSRDAGRNSASTIRAGSGKIYAYVIPPASGQLVTPLGAAAAKAAPITRKVVFPQYLGYGLYLALLASGFALWRSRRSGVLNLSAEDRRRLGAFGGLALLALFFSLGPFLIIKGQVVPLPYLGLLEVLPPLRFFRGPYRYNILVALALACLLVVILRQFQARRWYQPAVIGLFVCVLFEYAPYRAETMHYEFDLAAMRPFHERLARDGDVEVLLEDPASRVDGMLHSTQYWKPIRNGASGYDPGDYLRQFWILDTLPGPEAVCLLNHLGIHHVAVHGARIEDFRNSPHFALKYEENGDALFAISSTGKGLAFPRAEDSASGPIIRNLSTRESAEIKTAAGVDSATFSEYGLTLQILGPDPYLEFEPFEASFDGPERTLLVLDVLAAGWTTERTTGTVYWATESKPGFHESRAFDFAVPVDGTLHTIVVDLSASASWLLSKEISRIRLDPAADYPLVMTIRSLRLSPAGSNLASGLSGDESLLKDLHP